MNKCLGRTHRKRKKRKLKDPKSLDFLQNDVNYNFLCKWMGLKQYKPSKSLKPKHFEDTGRGLMTKQPIKSGDFILTIPESLLITPEVVLKSKLGAFFKKFCPKASGHQILSLFLMFERSKGESSEWSSYIVTLPESYNIPAFHGRYCLKLLPLLIHKQSLKQIETVEDSYTQLDPLLKNLECAFPFLQGHMNIERYKWAWCTVNTRCVYIDCFKEDCIGKSCQFHLALAPFLDLLNHSPDVQVQAGFNKVRKQYEIISLCNFEKYSQVFINYGSHDNWTLFLEYGFVVTNNSNDSVLFSKGDILSAYKFCNFSSNTISKKLQFIEENGLIRNLMCSSDGLSWNLKVILRILSSNPDLKLWKSRLRSDLESTVEEQLNFEKLQRKLIYLKIDELGTSKTVNEICFDGYNFFQTNVAQLFLIANSILKKAIKP